MSDAMERSDQNRPELRPALRHGVRRVVAMEVVSGLGDGVFWVGFTALLLERHIGAAGFTLAALARLGPRALASAPAGALADRVDRRRLLIGLDAVRAALMLGLAALAAVDGPVGIMLIVVALCYTAAAPYRPAVTAALPLVAGESDLASANAMVATVRQVMTFVGPLFGALLVREFDPWVAFAVNALSFVLGALLISLVREFGGHHGTRASMRLQREAWHADLTAGWLEVRAVAGLAVVTALVFVMYMARGAELVLFVLLANDHLGLGGAGVGLLSGAVGLGALAALPMSRRIANAQRPTLVLLLSLATTALPFALVGVTASTVLTCAALVVLGAGVVAFELTSVVLLQRLSRRGAMGSVFGLVGTTSNGGKLVGALVAPWLAASFGITDAMVLSAIVVVVLGGLSMPGLARLARSTRERQQQLAPIVTELAVLDLFSGANRAVLERLAMESDPVDIAPGTVVIRQGDRADHLYIVRTGDFDVFHGDTIINHVGAGEWFGEIGLLQRRRRTATVQARDAATAWCIPGNVFLSALQEAAAEPTAVMEVIGERLRRSEQADELSG